MNRVTDDFGGVEALEIVENAANLPRIGSGHCWAFGLERRQRLHGLSMIDAALGAKLRNRWWEFCKQ